MKTSIYLLVPLAVAAAVSSCGKKASGPVMAINTPYTASGEVFYAGAANAQRNAQAALGRRLFYDTRLSASNSVSCGSCHRQEAAFADAVAYSQGADGQLMDVHTPALTRGGSGQTVTGWGPGNTTFRSYIFGGDAHIRAMRFATEDDLALRLGDDPAYQALFAAAYPGEQVTVENTSGALSSFVTALKILPGNGKLLADNQATIKNPNAVTSTVVRYKCAVCHSGAGISALANHSLDGNWSSGPAESVPATNVAFTAPYLHDGSVPTLERMLGEMSDGEGAHPLPVDAAGRRQKMAFTAEERGHLLVWLNSLSDRSRMDDARFSNPFRPAPSN